MLSSLRQEHFHDILMAEQALDKRAVETLQNSLDFSAPAANIGFVVFHFFGHASYELAPKVNLQHLGPSQRAALVNRLESFEVRGSAFL